MKYLSRQILFREIPDEISLSFLITGCKKRCRGCHSSDSWDAGRGVELDSRELTCALQKYQKFITCVLFLGGEWESDNLIQHLAYIKSINFKTALYTGEDSVDSSLLEHLDYIKFGPYIQELGGLDSPTTNQKFYKVINGRLITTKFNREVSL